MHAARAETFDIAALSADIDAELARGAIEVPLIPEAATAVMEACGDVNADTRRLAAIVHRDPALAAGVVKIAQSAAYGGARVATLQHALTRLGATHLRQSVWVIVCRGRVFRAPGHDAEVRAVFRHSLVTAFHAQEIARDVRANVEEA